MRRQQALHCGHSGKSGQPRQRGRRVATGLRGYGACEAAEGVVQKSGAKDESSRSGTLTFNMTLTHLNAARPREKVEWGPALLESKSLSDLVSRRRATRPSRGHGRHRIITKRPACVTNSLTDAPATFPTLPRNDKFQRLPRSPFSASRKMKVSPKCSSS